MSKSGLAVLVLFGLLASSALAQAKMDLCALVKMEDVTRFTGFKFTKTGPSAAYGTTGSCDYKSEANFGYPSIAVQLWTNSDTNTAEASTKKLSGVEAVDGVGQRAYWYVLSGAGQLVVIVKPGTWFIINVNTYDKTGNGKFKESAIELGKFIIAQAKL